MTIRVTQGLLSPVEGVRLGSDSTFARERMVESLLVNALDKVTGLGPNEKHLVRMALVHAVDNKWSKAELRNRIQRIIGLGARYTVATDNYYNGLVRQGMSPSTARRRTNSYANRLLRHRAQVIADYELRRSAAEGKRSLWNQQLQDGKISEKAKRKFITHKDEKRCPICKKLNGKVISLKEEYPGGFVGPPLHPNCRCWEVLVV